MNQVITTERLSKSSFPVRIVDPIHAESHISGTDRMKFRSAFWEEDLGVATIGVKPTQYWTRDKIVQACVDLGVPADDYIDKLLGHAMPILVICDPLLYEHAPGDYKAYKPGTGLMSIDDGKGNPLPLYECLDMLIRQAVKLGMTTIIPRDYHTNPDDYIWTDRYTKTRLTTQLFNRLTPADQQVVKKYLQEALDSERQLTVAEWQLLYGKIRDREFIAAFDFEHCIAGRCRYIPVVEELLAKQKVRLITEAKSGIIAPCPDIITLGKTTIDPVVPPDGRGSWSNNFDGVILASQVDVPQGEAYKKQRLAAVCGAADRYTVWILTEKLIQLGFYVTNMASATWSIPTQESKAMVTATLRVRFQTYQSRYAWYERGMGPAPKGYNAKAAQVKALDDADHQRAKSFFGFINKGMIDDKDNPIFNN